MAAAGYRVGERVGLNTALIVDLARREPGPVVQLGIRYVPSIGQPEAENLLAGRLRNIDGVNLAEVRHDQACPSAHGPVGSLLLESASRWGEDRKEFQVTF